MYVDSALSLVVPLVVILLVLITRQVVLSLFVGIVLAGFMLKDSFFESLEYVYSSISSVFYSDGEVSVSSLYVFLFLVLLGILTQIMQSSGGMKAFVIWARERVNSPKGSEFLAFIAGIVIFIDDYFNALTVGQIARPLNDANHSTRERLAYIIDSTSAPICILMPISSWGAYILGITSGLIEGESGFSVLVSSIWGNYYAWFALLAVFLTIYWQINLSVMRNNQNVGIDSADELKYSDRCGNIWMLIIPIFSLIVFVGFFIFFTGYKATNSLNPIDMLSSAETGFSLFFGGLCALVISIFVSYKNIELKDYFHIVKDGFISMLPAILILILAWSIGPVIKNDLQTGVYLANISKDYLATSQLSIELIVPVILFLISGFIALCTGTSWGTFAIMLPIGAAIAIQNDVNITLSISAVLAGAVYGDHASPISDTTILSATGAGCSVQSHFITQLPYATTTAFVSVISFGVAGYFNSLLLGYIVGIVGIVGIFWFYKSFLSKGLA
ncbi:MULTISPECIES: Na+/H+ antiporter NhaC family protein [Helicobacter]|uniref:Na+/H+ antiporter NhaC family protein n=1 Tax=Helicobacter ibis TaxID=2962633 RepID=A0ABT4VBZ1_9HELI|nr:MULTISPECIES: Na+/H+ antiporter NhaC family protein [Helicobacter]MDA3967001.1 Na+/H+ antiporter NhaC family protein [Helicobacter sp. WB40]MDA3968227.1 Na+/H+ antiporter NhaC family protein [Helicobacter ibis]